MMQNKAASQTSKEYFSLLPLEISVIVSEGFKLSNTSQGDFVRALILLCITLNFSLAAADDGALILFKARAELKGAAQSSSRINRINRVRSRLLETARQSQARAIKLLRRNGVQFQSFYVTNAIAVSGLTPELKVRLLRLPEVEHIIPNAAFALRLPRAEGISEFTRNIPAQISAIGVDKVWSDFGITGKNITVGSIDTGVMWDHEAIITRYRGSTTNSVDHNFNWHDAVHKPIAPGPRDGENCPFSSAEPCDDHSHGTHTVGTMLGEQQGRERFGVAPDAKWIGCRGLDRGWGSVASYLECLEFMLAPYPYGGNPKTQGRPDLAPHVINISWICESKEGCTKGGELLEAVRALHAAGILLVVAAGNDGPACGTIRHAPAGYSKYVLTVGAYDHRNGSIAQFSSRGPSGLDGGLAPLLAAPGVFMRSSVPGSGGGDYDFKSGTSMAAPHVAGVVALLWSAKPQLIGKISETIDLLTKTARPQRSNQTCSPFNGGQVPNAVFGYGIVDALAAVKAP
jgi:subtilisin family serine protease